MEDIKEFEDWYNILKIESTATTNQIQNAYRKLAKIYHPDKNKTTEAVVMFEKISIAHTTLCNEEKRKLFDSQLFAKKEKKRKEMEMGNARKKMKEDLLSRESIHKKRKDNEELQRKHVEQQNEQFKQDFINQINKQMKEEQQKHRDQFKKDQEYQLVVKLKWKSKLNYTQDYIQNLLASYGEVDSFTFVETPSSSSSIALAGFQLLDSVLQILLNKDDLKSKYKIKVERFKGSNNGDSTDNIIFTNSNSNGVNTNTATSTFKSSNSTTTTTTTTTTNTSSSSSSSSISPNITITTTTSNSNSNTKIPDLNFDDDDEDDILLKMKSFKK
ncbi:hypothetical protein DICPUDRAFT_73996 [Dictyostelium purpureum]|uniref:J domain-containing protein n=1 Tax=Dictyostelium purpureum TaxID=5786 RepID=F0Z6H0_DICPU|nr:uncharacterized protein DICPUDRAFT_73996 [Dictyostelium purpureum]EGC40439.1 hypothetical protein DICPUDRAFT_73996 [Dictyostelium purpureum]|eukprot:XP_003282986.1 hypothetical protein DICPUDRAFT_73996 [Dictyostelium purpureum]